MNSAEYIAERVKNKTHSNNMLNLSYVMSAELLRAYGDLLTEHDKKMLTAYVSSQNAAKLKKIGIVMKYNMWKSGIIRKIGQLWLL